MIELKNIAVGHDQILLKTDHVKLEGGLTVLIGRNGVGKSTLLKSIMKQIPLIEGDVLINSESIRSINSLDLAKQVSFVPSVLAPIDYMRVFDFVGLGRSPYTNSFGRLTETDVQVIDEALELLGITHFKYKFLSEMSDGERQLVGLAHAVAQETPIMILDEPLSFLDYSNRIKILDQLDQLAIKMSKTILFTSHDFEPFKDRDLDYLLIDSNRVVQFHRETTSDQIIQICFGS